MIQLIGMKSHCDIDIRQKFSIISARLHEDLQLILEFVDEVVIINTCNRTEIYVNSKLDPDTLKLKIFDELKWDVSLQSFTFYTEGKDVVRHLMEVTCGFHSRILGEDQILGQVKRAYESALEFKSVGGKLQRLFQTAITCGKVFKNNCEITKIPVSFSSIVAKEAFNRGKKRFMIIGYGETGSLTTKYLLSYDIEVIYIVVKDINRYSDILYIDKRIKVISFNDRVKYYKKIDCIISCTSAPHTVVHKNDLCNKDYLIFDLSVPRDVEADVCELDQVEFYDVDSITNIDELNKAKRREMMLEYKYIIEDYIEEFMNWQILSEISTDIQAFKNHGEKVYSERMRTFNKKEHFSNRSELVEILLKSTSDAYTNRAINVLKEETLLGRGQECLRILKKIFQENQ